MTKLRTVRSRILIGTCMSLAAALPGTAFAGDLTGTVTDASDTRALQSAQLRLVELNRIAESDRDGSFRFADVPPGTYTLEATYVGAETRTQTVVVPDSGNATANVILGTDGTILVLGQSANMTSALSRQKAADGVESVLTRDAVGQFPDQNVAESLRRLPGINILNDQGEGRFVSVRGLDPELNATSVNGVRLPAPESDVRSVALDVISSDSIESIEVKKSLTPDMDADTIGASIEINTTSAFERRKNLLTFKVEGSYNDYSEKLTPKGSIDFAQRIGDNIGVSGGISYYQRKFETDNVEADGWDEDDGLIFPEEVNYRDYDVERKRLSANLNFDFRLGSSTKLYARGIYSQFDDQEYRRETSLKLEDAGEITANGDNVEFSDEDGELNIQRSLKDRFERQRIRSIVLGGETNSDGWRIQYSGSYAKSSERENGSIDPANFERTFEDEGLTIGLDTSNPRIPRYYLSGPANVVLGDFVDPSQYELDSIQVTALSDSRDEEWGAKLDVAREFAMDSGSFTIQAGAKGRWRDKSYNLATEYWENDDMTLADVVGSQTYRLIDISPVPDKKAVRAFFEANRGDFELNEFDSLFDSAVEDYSVSEDVIAGYLLGRWDSSTLRVIGGVRYEHTKNDIRANTVTAIEEDGTLPDGTTADEDTVIVAPNQFKRSYGDWLPSLTVRWEPQDSLVLRAAAYKSLVRPKLSKLAPRFTIEQNDDDEREGEFGNPDLKPYQAWNFDAGVEYYLPGNGALSAGVFYKDIKNFIVDTNIEDAGTYNGIAFDEATVPINGDKAKIWGLELSYQQALRFLPSPLDGFLVSANYTYTDATGKVPIDGDITDLRKIDLPSASKHTFNAALGYEKGPVSLRLAGTYRSKYLDELGDDADEDRIVDNHFQLDLSAKLDVTKNVQVFYEWVNINNAKYYAYNNVGARQNLLQFEQYKWTMKFGARVKF